MGCFLMRISPAGKGHTKNTCAQQGFKTSFIVYVTFHGKLVNKSLEFSAITLVHMELFQN